MVALYVPARSAALCVNSCVLTSHCTGLSVSIGVIWYHFGVFYRPLSSTLVPVTGSSSRLFLRLRRGELQLPPLHPSRSSVVELLLMWSDI